VRAGAVILDIVRIDRNRLVGVGKATGGLSHLVVRPGAAAVGLGKIRPYPDGLAEVPQRLLEPTEGQLGLSQDGQRPRPATSRFVFQILIEDARGVAIVVALEIAVGAVPKEIGVLGRGKLPSGQAGEFATGPAQLCPALASHDLGIGRRRRQPALGRTRQSHLGLAIALARGDDDLVVADLVAGLDRHPPEELPRPHSQRPPVRGLQHPGAHRQRLLGGAAAQAELGLGLGGDHAAVAALAERSLLEWTVVDPGSVNITGFDQMTAGENGILYANPDEHIRAGLAIAERHGIHPSYAIYEPGFLRQGAHLAHIHPRMPAPIYRFMFSDGFAFGFPPETYALEAYLELLQRVEPGARWMVAGLAVDIRPLIEPVLARGGHIRVGLEDAPLGSPWSNLEWVEHAVAMIEDFGGTLASAADIRAALKTG